MLFDKYRRICTNDHLSKTIIILFRQTVRTFTLEHLISYALGLGFLFVFFILPTARFRGIFRGYPECSEMPPYSPQWQRL